MVDRYSRRTLMMIADVVRAIGWGVVAWSMIRGEMTLAVLLAVAAVSATCRTFHRPALQASIAQLVPEQALNRANSLFQMAEAGANLIAPAVGGALVAWLGAGAAVAVSALTCAVAAATLLLVALPPLRSRAEAGAAPRRNLFRELGDGLAYLWTGQRMLFFMLCTFALVNFALAPIGPLLPFVAQHRLGTDAGGLGLLMTGFPAGTLAGALIISAVGSRLRRGLGVVWGITVVGLLLAAVGQTQSLWVAVAAFAAMGVAISVVNVCSSGLFQTLVPQEMQGRVFAVRSSIAQAASPVSLALVGAVSTAVPPHLIILASGVMVAASGLLGYAVPGLVKQR
ncbi:MAG: MFS transporter [Limnochordales bacterium]